MESLLFSYVGVCNVDRERGSDCELQKKKKVSGFVSINRNVCFLVRQPPVAQGLLIYENSRSYTTTNHSR